MIDLEAIRQRVSAAESGPWLWRGSLRYSGPRLVTRNSRRGEHTVMDFVRLGMQYAQPRFQRPDGLMDKATNEGMAIFEVCPSATRADDPRVYRDNIIGFRNGNAEFIAHARQDIDDLLSLVEELQEKLSASNPE
jgi:hypothetical protein